MAAIKLSPLTPWIKKYLNFVFGKLKKNDEDLITKDFTMELCECLITCCCIQKIIFNTVKVKDSYDGMHHYLHLKKSDEFFGSNECLAFDGLHQIRIIMNNNSFKDQVYNDLCDFQKQFDNMVAGYVIVQEFQIQHVYSPSISEFIFIISKAKFIKERNIEDTTGLFIMEDTEIKEINKKIINYYKSEKPMNTENLNNSTYYSSDVNSLEIGEISHKSDRTTSKNQEININQRSNQEAVQILEEFENVQTPLSSSQLRNSQPYKALKSLNESDIEIDNKTENLIISNNIFNKFLFKYPDIDIKSIFHCNFEQKQHHKPFIKANYSFRYNIYENFLLNCNHQFKF